MKSGALVPPNLVRIRWTDSVRMGQFALEQLEPRYLFSANLDPSFGVGGHVRDAGQAGRDYIPYGTGIQYIAVQTDGRIIASGDGSSATDGFSSEVILQRFLPDGQVDPTFHFAGIVGSDSPIMLPQPDGKLLLLLSSASASDVLVRLNPDGSLDPTFKFQSAPLWGPGEYFLGDDAALLPDGRIVVLGTSPQGPGPDFFDRDGIVTRYLPDGTPDPTFGVGGVVVEKRENGLWLAMQPDGMLLTLVHPWGASALRRRDSHGQLDPTFGSAGSVTLPDETWDALNEFPQDDLIVQPDGGILVGLWNDKTGGAIIRLRPDGSPDTSFGDGGRVELPKDTRPRSMLLAPDGKIVVTFVGSSADNHISLVRLNADGTRDSTFGPDGIYQLPDTAWGFPQAALQGDKIVILADEADNQPPEHFFHLLRIFDEPAPAATPSVPAPTSENASDEPVIGVPSPKDKSAEPVLSAWSSDELFKGHADELDWEWAPEIWA